MEEDLHSEDRADKALQRTSRQREADPGEKHIERVRRICLALPETREKLSHGEPTFFVGKKVFAMCSINHHNDGHIAVTIPAAIGIQEALIKAAPKKFYRPPYVGVRGWVGIELTQVSDKELAEHISEAWRLIAPKKLQDAIVGSARTHAGALLLKRIDTFPQSIECRSGKRNVFLARSERNVSSE